ncbi:MAG: hypothetical protein IT292_08305 [Deltaproteobacteria bacterium]|nr:hypothetical protein [Deltaproteobacteria bacterium]
MVINRNTKLIFGSQRESGMLEYVLLTAVIACALIGTIGAIGHQIEKTFLGVSEVMGASGHGPPR